MRRLFGCWILSGLLVAGAGSLAFAGPSVAEAGEGPSVEAAVVSRGDYFRGLRDEATMVLVGTLLIGLAGAVRRAA